MPTSPLDRTRLVRCYFSMAVVLTSNLRLLDLVSPPQGTGRPRCTFRRSR